MNMASVVPAQAIVSPPVPYSARASLTRNPAVAAPALGVQLVDVVDANHAEDVWAVVLAAYIGGYPGQDARGLDGGVGVYEHAPPRQDMFIQRQRRRPQDAQDVRQV